MARRVDDLGRIVVPVEMRRMFGIKAGDALEISVEDSGIVLRKVETRCVFCGGAKILRSYREKQLCSSCSLELGIPAPDELATPLTAAEPQGDLIDAPPWES
ncbi:MAG: AbrB/MazE/SpoVT family DNA-binding domain-containing protein [Acidimicrobiales bacterium]